ncbi:type A chloramphenicol O-acetyltransferase [Occultella glacieicola]|uniref:Chloramphenicol acetyltransferase n=1 Tax=Occultella glacieicola TaxID=2518684 RepID=A0ABY2E6C1_9MICO|nr:type A chloramphenicol O-acetyltransferase [Occultella glacieicola]TDE94813.1 type A chloramphenicol O-acetyltransferase [Occultella glacieicola]
MDSPIPIDLATWPRRQHFEHYLHAVPCTYSMTVELDVTEFVRALRNSPRRTYVAQIWALGTIVNAREEFRMCLTESDAPAVWPVLHPSFTLFNAERETFSSVWAPYDPDFATFHDGAAALLDRHRDSTEFFPVGGGPPNTFDVSSLPWASFTGFNLNIRDAWRHLAPIFTLGRYQEGDGRVFLPLALQVHHAAADGFHSARFVNELQAVFADPSWVP